MEADISRNCVNSTFENIRFVYNALARPGQHYYACSMTLGNHLWRPCIMCDGRYVRFCGIAWLGGFAGPIVPFLPEAVHAPRGDNVSDCERGKVQLRRRNRRAGVRAIP